MSHCTIFLLAGKLPVISVNLIYSKGSSGPRMLCMYVVSTELLLYTVVKWDCPIYAVIQKEADVSTLVPGSRHCFSCHGLEVLFSWFNIFLGLYTATGRRPYTYDTVHISVVTINRRVEQLVGLGQNSD